MKIDIDSPARLGAVIRASRKAMKVRQDDAAGLIGVSENFLGKVESGAETVQWGKLFQVMQQLGLSLTVEVPASFTDDIRKALADTGPQRKKPGSNSHPASGEAD
ncbi:helix-turn-helix domain-containing protein [Pseudomonas sp. 21LCFQ02]|uniref:helix-turn-helix domain-containing protein n=1 Tax=Pseudomonas sp. 21LCFQ02 TaxID=2957505 RepID=UPI00209B7E9C|nr:helix-turn-helix domain-containing protein [Pseudomonas sp. 21LCFQ02]MCO8167144.1 helix-turn-helix domain-containing protein [Pseudomonas sp. 21LCFQ02]